MAKMIENKTAKKWKSIFRWLGWIAALVAKFSPSNIRVWAIAFSSLAGGLVALLDRCDQQSSPPAPLPSPTVTASPTPTPQPTPTRPPLPELKAPHFVKSGVPFEVQLCNAGNVYQTSLYADGLRLGYVGFGKPCMRVHITLDQRGKRELMAMAPGGLRVYTDVIVQ